MAIKKTTRRVMPSARVTASRRVSARRPMVAPRSINAGTSITSSARSRMARPQSNVGIKASSVRLSPEQRIFANQLINNTRRVSVMGATNTTALTVSTR